MLFRQTPLEGLCVVEVEPHRDERGLFARTYCRREFEDSGLPVDFPQCNTSYNLTCGTLRGMHYQAEPHEEGKLVRCVRGSIFDVVIDLRPDSPTFCNHFGIELNAENRSALFVPTGFAHGFQTLVDDTEVFYQMTEFYNPGAGRGVRWNDPRFGIGWPLANPLLCDRDASYPDFDL